MGVPGLSARFGAGLGLGMVLDVRPAAGCFDWLLGVLGSACMEARHFGHVAGLCVACANSW